MSVSGRINELYRLTLGSRLAEQRITDLSKAGEIPGHHSGLNHEAVGVGIGTAVDWDDCVQTSYRSGAAVMHARGGLGVRELVLQGFGLLPGPREQHPGGPRTLRSTGIVGGQLPMAVGVALSYQLKGLPSVVVAVIGDGAASEGAVHECMNIAGVRRLPILFVIENNGIALSTLFRDSTAAAALAARGAGYGIRASRVDGHDAVAVHHAVRDAVARLRAGAGPEIIETLVSRPAEHATVIPDVRSQEDLDRARRIDCVAVLRDRLLASGALDEQADAELVRSLSAIVDAAVAEARTARAAAAPHVAAGQVSDAQAWRMAHAVPPPTWMERETLEREAVS
jgi:TPP-dependent pyruvate/acetoin dehydrogenase alpha subunit